MKFQVVDRYTSVVLGPNYNDRLDAVAALNRAEGDALSSGRYEVRSVDPDGPQGIYVADHPIGGKVMVTLWPDGRVTMAVKDTEGFLQGSTTTWSAPIPMESRAVS